jgi:hypothetical protein
MQDRSSHSSSVSAEPLYLYQLINELINEIYQSGLILKLDANSIVNNEVDIIENFNAIGFYPHCTRNVPAN